MARKTNTKYPFVQLEPNTYFEIPAGDRGAELVNGGVAPRVASTAYSYAKRHGFKIAIRKMDGGSVKVYRTK